MGKIGLFCQPQLTQPQKTQSQTSNEDQVHCMKTYHEGNIIETLEINFNKGIQTTEIYHTKQNRIRTETESKNL